jgi:hypothetical protein
VSHPPMSTFDTCPGSTRSIWYMECITLCIDKSHCRIHLYVRTTIGPLAEFGQRDGAEKSSVPLEVANLTRNTSALFLSHIYCCTSLLICSLSLPGAELQPVLPVL